MSNIPQKIATISKSSKPIYNIVKRVLDIVLSFTALVVLSPVFLIISLAIIYDSGLPVFFCQKRAGQFNKPFTIFKFRTMKVDNKTVTNQYKWEQGVPDTFVFKTETSNNHLSRLSHFLRKTSLDELPQFLNVFLGQMSLVGPRPELIEIANCYTLFQQERLAVKPGITGLAQINGRSEITHKEKIQFDLDYYHQYNLWLDLKILMLTVVKVFKKEGAI